jgi:HAE1 family hydrophobic/amphiphilic exporter-1
MVTLAVATFGYMAVLRLPVELLPDLSYPTLTVQTVYEDAAPLSVEQFVTKPVEEAIGVIPGVRSMRSVSRSGLSEVILEFDWDREMDFAALDVREKLGLVRLPQEAEPPRVLRFDPTLDPIIRLAFAGDRPLGDLRQLAERWLKPRLESVLGVAAAKVRGGLDPEVIVEADEGRLAALGLTVDDLATALEAENVNQPGGTLKDFNAVYLVRTLHEFADLEQLRETIVRTSAGGRVRVEDVARVFRGHRDRDEITRSGGSEVVGLDLHREGSANTVGVAAAVAAELAAIRADLPADLSLTVLSDQSRYISDAIAQVWWAALLGGLLAVVVLYFFLRDLPSTLIIALSIPVSVLATFLPMQQAGVSLNIMSLGGLALGVGMLVDNSIVVLEAIDRRRQEGLSRAAAACLGATEVSGAVTASTLTTVSVFFPIVFVQGIAGQLFYDQAVTVCFSLLASLVVALTLIPALTALNVGSALETATDPPAGQSSSTLFRWDQPAVASPRRAGATTAVGHFVRAGAGGTGAGKWLLNWLALPIPRLLAVPLLALLALADLLFPYLGTIRLGRLTMLPLGNGGHAFSRLLSVGLYPLRLAVFLLAVVLGGTWWLLRRVINVLFWPAGSLLKVVSDAYPAWLQIALRWRWALIATAFILFGLAAAELPRLGTNLVPDLSQGQFAFQLHFPEGTPLQATGEAVAGIEKALIPVPVFANISSLIGSLPSSASGRRTLGENLAQIDFKLAPDVDAEEEARAVARVRRALALYPQAAAELVRPSILTVRSPVAVHVFAEDLELLEQTATQVTGALTGVAGITDVASSAEAGNPEVRVELDRERAGTLGVSPAQVGNALRRKIRGDKIGEFREGEERLDIRLRASLSDRDKATDVGALRISLPDGTAVPISAVAHVTVGRGPATIQRTGGSRMAEITAKVTSGNLGGTLGKVREAVAGLRLPVGASMEMAGQDEELQVSYNSLRLMLALAVFLVYVVMAAQFESLIHPFVILFSVPLGLVGVVGALWLTSHAISVLVFIGAVMLAGIVVNNAIVLVDAVNRRRRDGEDLEAALVGGGRERLRPILMTTTTTVLALLPMSLGLGAGDELRAPLAITVIGGLLVATLFTLVVVPCVYRILTRTAPEASA